MREQTEVEEVNQTQLPPWLVINKLFCYEGEKQRGKAAIPTIQRKHSNSNEAYTDGSKSTGRKVGYAAIFAY